MKENNLLKQSKQNLQPVKLTDENVSKLYGTCLATLDTPNSDLIKVKSFHRELTDTETDFSIFSKESLLLHSSDIKYLIGQIYGVHAKYDRLSFTNGAIAYNKKQWTGNLKNLLHLYDLGIGSGNIDPFIGNKQKSSTDIGGISPTLSPDDPNFTNEWFEKYKKDFFDPTSERFEKHHDFLHRSSKRFNGNESE